LKCFQIADEKLKGGLKGKTVFIPAGLSGTGVYAIQLAKIFGAGKIVTTLSTAKIESIEKYLGHAMPDQMVDYTKENVVKAIGKGTVDFMFDTVGISLSASPVMKKGGVIMSISTVPNGTHFNQLMGGMMPKYIVWTMNIVNWLVTTWLRWKGIDYSCLQKLNGAIELELLTGWIEEGKFRPVIGRKAKLSDIEEVRAGCQQIFDAKGGVGKFVIEID
jgi:NADPH:quinone reductase-like Zn-dependent oxidoreductase